MSRNSVGSPGSLPPTPTIVKTVVAILMAGGAVSLMRLFWLPGSQDFPSAGGLETVLLMMLGWALLQRSRKAQACLMVLCGAGLVVAIRHVLYVLWPESVSGEASWSAQDAAVTALCGGLGLVALWFLFASTTNHLKEWFRTPMAEGEDSPDKAWAELVFIISLLFLTWAAFEHRQLETEARSERSASLAAALRNSSAAEAVLKRHIDKLEEAGQNVFSFHIKFSWRNAVTGEVLEKVACVLPEATSRPEVIQSVGVSFHDDGKAALLTGFSNNPVTVRFEKDGFESTAVLIQKDPPEQVTLDLQPLTPPRPD
jgi:hypothetical protein